METSILTPIEHAVDGSASYGFGRLISIDPKDRGYLLPRKAISPTTRRFRHYATAKALNQGDFPHCVAYAWEQYLLSAPIKNKQWKTPVELYHEAQLRDEWEGEDYDGSSVRGGAKALQEFGYLKSYNWAFDVQPVVSHLLNVSPVVFGTNWYWGMFEPDREGFIHVEGALAGGHAYMIKGVNLDKKCPDGSTGALRIINSWGENWGEKGMVWISLTDADRLIKEWGEACTAMELKFKVEAQG